MRKLKVGLQLFTIRDEVQKDMDSALKRVKEMGYDCVEFAGYYDHSSQEIRAMLDKYNLKCVSVHQYCNVIMENPEKEIEFIRDLGAEFCVIPWKDINVVMHDEKIYSEFKKELKFVADGLKKYNIQLGYHNHEFEFNKIDGKYYLDKLYEDVPADILCTQIDTCWAHFGGVNPSEYLKKYEGRAKIIHFKDFECSKFPAGPVYDLIAPNGVIPTRSEIGFEFRPVGYGRQNFPEIIEVCKSIGTEYIIVEQDVHGNSDAMDNARLSCEYLKNVI